MTPNTAKSLLAALEGEYDVRVRPAHMPHLEISICGLCGNHGMIHQQVPAPPCGYAPDFKPPFIHVHCVCPNGRALKKRDDKAANKLAKALKSPW